MKMARDVIDMEEDMQIDDSEIFGLADSNQSETEDAERPPPLHPNFEREFLGHTGIHVTEISSTFFLPLR